MLTQKYIKDILNYDTETGFFTWKKRLSNRAKVGDIAGADNHSGYIKIGICGKIYFAHRLAWIYMTGKEPDIIDHINRIRSDNRWENLRNTNHAGNSANQANRKGVRKRYGRWYARYNNIHLGVFDTKEEAVTVRKNYVIGVLGFHPDHV